MRQSMSVKFTAAGARAAVAVGLALACAGWAQDQPAAPAVVRKIGVVKSIGSMQLTVTPDSGGDVTVAAQSSTRVLRVAPGEKDLKNATPAQWQDIQVGDRILAGGKAAADGTLTASTVVLMKHSDVEATRQQAMQDWQKRGIDGPATAVDAAAGTVTISVGSLAAKKSVVVRASKGTVIRKYAADSAQFENAKPSTLQELHAGDQVRARGDRSADGSELQAEEIVFGSFQNLAGTVNGVDAGASTVSLHDLLSRKTVTVKVAGESQLRSLPPEMAQRIAARLKASMTGGAAAGGATGQGQGANGSGAGGNGARSGGSDFQRLLTHLPASSLTDLHKGEAVIALSTQGMAGEGTVVILLTGVEPILQAAPGGSGAAFLTPWSLSMPAGDAGGP